jgi:hypothetical protein
MLSARRASLNACILFSAHQLAARKSSSLAEDAFSLYEGPSSTQFDPYKLVFVTSAYTEFHIMCAIAPRLALLLRHELLPDIVENKDPAVKQKKQEQLTELVEYHTCPEQAKSLLEDLRVSRPRNIGVGDGQASFEQLCFPFFTMNSKQVQAVDSVILEEGYDLRPSCSVPKMR